MSIVYTPPAHRGLDILFQDQQLIVLNKPAGLLAVPGRGADRQDSLASRVQQEFPEALVVHRLDMSTSGIMLMALNPRVHRDLNTLFEQRAVHKRYIAVVAGQPDPRQGEINLPLITDWPNRPRQMVDHQRGKASLTHYQVLAYDSASNSSRIELTPITGRTHQLRVHMQSIGHAILGDRLYASDTVSCQSTRLLLHASHLSLRHPVTGQQLSIENPAPF